MCSRVFHERLIAVSCQSCTGDVVSTSLHPLVGLVTIPAGEDLNLVACERYQLGNCVLYHIFQYISASLGRFYVCSFALAVKKSLNRLFIVA
jgi:hypothetical protein